MIMLLIAILAVVAMSRMVDMTSMRIDLAAKKLQSDIRYAQSLAVNTQKRTLVRFNVASDEYTILIEGGLAWNQIVNPLTQEDDFIVTLNQGEFIGVDMLLTSFDGPPNTRHLLFDEWGNPYSFSGGVSLPLANRGTIGFLGSRFVRIEKGTGRVYID
ncbi:Tfp pilus assembly protein FimT/FimU [Candidatus Omnitrophota bacterium]